MPGYMDMVQGQDGSYGLPKLPTLQEVLGDAYRPSGAYNAHPDTIFRLLSAPQAHMTDALPRLQDLLIGSQGPAVQAIRQGAASNRASAQSDAMRRGLTGSDIEAANMNMATQAGEQQVGQHIAQQSNALAQYIMQALGMDIQGNAQMFQTLAQALGQELGAQRDILEAQRARDFAAQEGAKNRRAQMIGAGIGAVGSLGGGLMSGAGQAGGPMSLLRG